MTDVAIIGCGIVGAAAAYELSKYELDIVIIERDNDVANAVSKANSAILHAGYDPAPGTLMAKVNVRGAYLAAGLCKKLDIPYKKCGSLTVAFSEEEKAEIECLYQRGRQNGVEGLELLDRDAITAMEPNISKEALLALFAPTAAIVNPWEYTLALAETAVRNGAGLRLKSEVLSIDRLPNGYTLQTKTGTIETKHVINAAGLYADMIHDMVAPHAFGIIPDRGEYYLLDKSEGDRVRHVVFQCPTRIGKGTLVSPTVHGNLIVGPNNEAPQGREDTATTAEGLEYVMRTAKKSVPSIDFRQSVRNFSGVRAASDRDDFIIAAAEGATGFIDLAGIKSPGLTAAPAIAEMAAGLLAESGLELRRKKNFIDSRKRIKFNELTLNEKTALVKENPAYGRVICRCETVTEGEIIDCLRAPIPPGTIDGVKRRCGTGMGRCQGGFCGPRVLEILAAELGLSPTDVLQDREGSFVLSSETKGGFPNGQGI